MIMKTLERSTLLLMSFWLAGCVALSSPENDHFPRYQGEAETPSVTTAPVELALSDRLSLPEPDLGLASRESEALYSFVIKNMEVDRALRLFSRAYGLNVVVAEDVVGVIDVEFYDLPLHQAMSLMLGSMDYYWLKEDGIIKVRSQETRQFSIDYLRLIRSGSGTATAKVSSGSSEGGGEGGGGGGGGDDASSIVIGHSDEVDFWQELQGEIEALLSDDGRVVLNRLSGTVVVSDQHRYVAAIGNYLDQMQRSIHRQVDIRVRILEVRLDDNSALGVNWSRIADAVDTSDAVDLLIDGTIGSPAGGFDRADNTFTLQYFDQDSGNNLSALVDALKEQGDVEIVSQPHVRSMNNQTSLIKVGTDRTFFRREQSTDSTSAGSLTTATDIPQVVTEGVVLSITPQIADNGWIMMDVSPVVTRVSSVSTVTNDNGVIQSSAPNLDIAQVTSLVRARSGETVVIGGLIQTQSSVTQRSIPGTNWMGPLKNLAGGTYDAQVKSELVMVLTPVIVDGRTARR